MCYFLIQSRDLFSPPIIADFCHMLVGSFIRRKVFPFVSLCILLFHFVTVSLTLHVGWSFNPFDADLNKNDDPQYYQINTSPSLAFLAKHIPLTSLFPSKSGLEAKLAVRCKLE